MTGVYHDLCSSTLIGLNVSLAICYAKQDLNSVAYNIVQNYLRVHPNSPFARNLNAAIIYRTVSSKGNVEEESALGKNMEREFMAMAPELEGLLKQKLYPEAEHLIRHNLVLFRKCETALQVLPSLMKHVPEARINLILYHLNNGSQRIRASHE